MSHPTAVDAFKLLGLMLECDAAFVGQFLDSVRLAYSASLVTFDMWPLGTTSTTASYIKTILLDILGRRRQTYFDVNNFLDSTSNNLDATVRFLLVEHIDWCCFGHSFIDPITANMLHNQLIKMNGGK